MGGHAGVVVSRSELTSMGIESIYNDPIRMMREGPGLFNFIFENVLR